MGCIFVSAIAVNVSDRSIHDKMSLSQEDVSNGSLRGLEGLRHIGAEDRSRQAHGMSFGGLLALGASRRGIGRARSTKAIPPRVAAERQFP